MCSARPLIAATKARVDALVGRASTNATVQRLQAAAEDAKALHMPFMEGMLYFYLMMLQPTEKTHSHKAKQLFLVSSKHYAGKTQTEPGCASVCRPRLPLLTHRMRGRVFPVCAWLHAHVRCVCVYIHPPAQRSALA